jgi:hypothetical protein
VHPSAAWPSSEVKTHGFPPPPHEGLGFIGQYAYDLAGCSLVEILSLIFIGSTGGDIIFRLGLFLLTHLRSLKLIEAQRAPENQAF